MRGDPKEFPREIRTVTSRSACNLILFPWRESQYVERLFWGSLKCSSAPIAIVVMLETALTPTIADIAIGVVNRGRSETVSRRRSTSGASGMSDTLSQGGQGGYSEGTSATAVPIPSSPISSFKNLLQREKREREAFAGSPVTSEDGFIAAEDPLQNISIKTVLAVITG